jgi:hypothetical protein
MARRGPGRFSLPRLDEKSGGRSPIKKGQVSKLNWIDAPFAALDLRELRLGDPQVSRGLGLGHAGGETRGT